MLILLSASIASGRDWTTNDEKTVKGDFVRLEGETVFINGRDGEQRVPLGELGPVDQALAWQLDGETKREALVDAAGGIKAQRVWTSTSGHTLEASYGGMNGVSVTLIAGRQRHPIAFNELSQKDQQFVRHAMDKRLLGTWLPPTADGKMPQARRFVVKGNVMAAVLAGIDRKGNLILHTGGKLSYQPMIGFGIEDEKHIREEFASRGLAKLIPADANAREWTDWKGEKFRGRVLPVTFRNSPINTVYMALEGEQFEKNILEFSAASQLHLRKLAAEGGVNVSFWPPILPDPKAPVHTYHLTSGDKSWEVEGRYVSADGQSVFLRTANSSGERIYLSAMSRDDRRQLNKYLRSSGLPLLPVVADHCPQLEFDLGDDVFRFAAEPVSGAGDVLEVYLPDSSLTGVRSRPRQISWAALTPAARQAVRDEFTATGVKDTLVDEGLGPPIENVEEREWTMIAGDEEVQSRGTLRYVDSRSGRVTILGSSSAALYDLSLADQKYVANVVLNKGFDQFKRSDPQPFQPGESFHHTGASGMHSGPGAMHSGMHSGPSSHGADFRTIYFCSRCNARLPGKVPSGYRCVCGAVLVSEEEYQRSGGVRSLARQEPTYSSTDSNDAHSSSTSYTKVAPSTVKQSGAFGYGEFVVLFWAGVGIAAVTVFGLLILGITWVARLGMK